ncbi:MAG: aminoglycoside phosphotransferase family protein [Anaerolineae bacterium]
MPAVRMHPDEVETDAALVRRLLATQFPHWADLPIRRVPSTGTDNAIYRLGDDLAARLPRIHWAAELVHKEWQWLPRLAPHLPLTIPVPLAKGVPGEGYPWHWSVTPWLPGENATVERLADPHQAAKDLAGFILALEAIAVADGPPAGPLNFNRGVPLTARDAATRGCIAEVSDLFDPAELTAAWDAALQAPAWQRPPVWIHGDLQSGNLLAVDGRLSAVIDFGCLGVGDPAAELIVAWNLFPAEARGVFRAALGFDDATWARGRGWALSVALVALPYYRHTNPTLAVMSRRTIEEVLAEQGGG